MFSDFNMVYLHLIIKIDEEFYKHLNHMAKVKNMKILNFVIGDCQI